MYIRMWIKVCRETIYTINVTKHVRTSAVLVIMLSSYVTKSETPNLKARILSAVIAPQYISPKPFHRTFHRTFDQRWLHARMLRRHKLFVMYGHFWELYVCLCVCLYVLYVHVCICTCRCICVYVYVCMYICMGNVRIHTE
jgi:hypothetical protein